jgi:hypothetical protein
MMIHHRPRRPEFDLASLNFLAMTFQCPTQTKDDPARRDAVDAGRKIDEQSSFRINLSYKILLGYKNGRKKTKV